jgi:hypothetical protein
VDIRAYHNLRRISQGCMHAVWIKGTKYIFGKAFTKWENFYAIQSNFSKAMFDLYPFFNPIMIVKVAMPFQCY